MTRDDVKHGKIVAAGEDILLVAVDGPWSNAPHYNEQVHSRDAQPGDAPSMIGRESILDYVYRCTEIVNRPRDLDRLRAEAERLGVRIER